MAAVPPRPARRARTCASSRRGSTGAPTSGPTSRRSTSSSTSASSRTTRPTPCPASPTASSSCCRGWRTTPARSGVGAASSSDCGRAPGSVTSPSTSPCSCRRRPATTSGAARPARSRASPADYNVIYGYTDETVGLAAGELAVRLVNDLVSTRRASTSTPSSTPSYAGPSGPLSGRRPRRSSRRRSAATSPSSGSTRPRLVQLGQGVHQQRIRATMTSQDRRPGRRHRGRQGPDDQAARLGGAARAQAGVGAHAARRADAAAAGSATRSSSSRWTATTDAGSASTCRTTTRCEQGLRHRRGRVPARLRHRRVAS